MKWDSNNVCGFGYTVIFISHEETIEREDGTLYTQPKGSSNIKDSTRFIKDLCDFRFYIKSNGVDKETGKTIMSTAYCTETESFYAGSRFDIVPVVNPFSSENIINAIIDAQKRSAENAGAELVEFKLSEGYTKQDYLDDIKPYAMKLSDLYPEESAAIVESQLGANKRISEAREDQLVELETIYNNLVALAQSRGVTV